MSLTTSRSGVLSVDENGDDTSAAPAVETEASETPVKVEEKAEVDDKTEIETETKAATSDDTKAKVVKEEKKDAKGNVYKYCSLCGNLLLYIIRKTTNRECVVDVRLLLNFVRG